APGRRGAGVSGGRGGMGEGYQLAVRIFSVLIIGFGLAILVVTLARGGGPAATGILFGILFVALGVGRLYISLRG
ncbi:MAG: hypothetical protein ACRDL6_11260, partial [Solirubrobacterales bacterium]